MPFAGLNPHRLFAGERWTEGLLEDRMDAVAEETPVALIYNDQPHVVMMASPQDLEDFAIGFSLSEGLIRCARDIDSIERLDHPEGIAMQLRCAPASLQDLGERRRNLTGRTGCGLCGAETLAQAMRTPRQVGQGSSVSPQALQRALALLTGAQPLNMMTGAVHAAAWCDPDGNIVSLREDVGRHNAMDKLIGAKARAGESFEEGFLLLTSRASYELVLKASMLNIALMVAVSAPTGLAIRIASEAGITLAAFLRNGRHTVYTRPDRLHPFSSH
jgi:formate dehydrogenase accessory protein FdhD